MGLLGELFFLKCFVKNVGARDPGNQSSFSCLAGQLGHSLYLGLCLSPTPTGGRWVPWPPWALPTPSMVKETKDAGTWERLSFPGNIRTSAQPDWGADSQQRGYSSESQLHPAQPSSADTRLSSRRLGLTPAPLRAARLTQEPTDRRDRSFSHRLGLGPGSTSSCIGL